MATPKLSFRPATNVDAAALAVLVDIAGEGMPAYMWSTLKASGQSVLEFGRERAGRDTGGFSYKNAVIAEIGGEIAATLIGYRLDNPYDLEAVLPARRRSCGHSSVSRQRRRVRGTSTCSRPSPSSAAGALGASCSPSPSARGEKRVPRP
jgi:hypothetical protein